MQDLIDLAKEQTKLVERENWKYYYQVDNYKFNNVYLANWYEKEHNSWATYVAQSFNEIKEKLSSEIFDINKDYNLEYLKKLRKENSYLQLFFSGGVDSYTILKLAADNNIFIDEVVCVATGNNLNAKENYEITKNALPIAKKYKEKFGKLVIKQVTLDDYNQIYKDPYSLLKYPESGALYPVYRRMWNNYKYLEGIRIFGPEKPQLVYYDKRWFAVMLDSSLNGFYAVDPQSIYFNYESENIFSLIKDSRLYRNYIVKNKMIVDQNLSFFKIRNDQTENKVINRDFNIKKQYKKSFSSGPDIWNYKDHYALCDTVKQQHLDLLRNYYVSVNCLMNIYPDYNYTDRNLGVAKFGWFIDIDSLDIYTQQELIPNGFINDMA